MNKMIIACCLAIPLLFACTKEGDKLGVQKKTYTVAKNAFRAVEISGKNQHWGEYKLAIQYRNELLDTAKHYNASGHYKGYIRAKINSKTNYEYTVTDFVYKIDTDSIQRLDEKLANKHGAGNYSLEDSIPFSAESLYKNQIILNEEGSVAKQTIVEYVPGSGSGTGTDYDYKYDKYRQFIHVYEYNENGNAVAQRSFTDLFDLNDADKFTRTIAKNEFEYAGNLLRTVIEYAGPGGENFTEANRYHFTYSGNKLTSVTGKEFTKQFSYNGERISTIVCNGTTYTYEFDNNGNVTKIDDGQGNYMNIKYEAGHGNISEFLPVLEILMGSPYIR